MIGSMSFNNLLGFKADMGKPDANHKSSDCCDT